MRYPLLMGICLSIATNFPTTAQTAAPFPYEVKLRAYIGCVERESRKNAGTLGNTLESATKAQESCDGLYQETIKTAAGTGAPMEAFQGAMESSKKAAPHFMTNDIEWLIDNAFSNAAARQIFMDNCPNTNRDQANKEKQKLLADIPRIDARYKEQALYAKALQEAEVSLRTDFFNPDGSAKPTLEQACNEWSK